ncbi:LuxR C-terminal-related transcriptional regulator [Nocardioides piscis]|uniref:DNA-binding response regulator n=1 Tax=Nocardioides piscis TaxID=2714938 RepID=A0A6G7YEU1_9ACTN|nr:LuxR C-terminal-related transcriptional regulator [Nocardioides piscis]QIK75158.1 DNA-binding response regulator [Nocardioides piscis]
MDELYRTVLTGSGGSLGELAQSLFVTPEQLLQRLGPLIANDIVRVDGDTLDVASPVDAVSRFVTAQADALAEAGSQLRRIASSLPVLVEMGGEPAHAPSTVIGAEVDTDSEALESLLGMIAESHGDLCFLRPDQWRLSSESTMALAVNSAVRSGRRVRAIYPAGALKEAPEILIGRAAIGEQIRVLPEVPSRLAIVGATRAVLPDPLGVRNQRWLIVQHQTIVASLTAWFDLLWGSATAVPMLDRGEARPDLRRLLLAQLAAGAKDEQIARNLGTSLRTVRRRVASLMDELGVDSRFQAGAEAARRGWL